MQLGYAQTDAAVHMHLCMQEVAHLRWCTPCLYHVVLCYAMLCCRKPSGLDDTPAQLVVKGDASVTCIAAASVLAKVKGTSRKGLLPCHR